MLFGVARFRASAPWQGVFYNIDTTNSARPTTIVEPCEAISGEFSPYGEPARHGAGVLPHRTSRLTVVISTHATIVRSFTYER